MKRVAAALIASLASLVVCAAASAADPTVTEFGSGIETGDAPIGIAAGPDGSLWFTNNISDEIAEITPAGVVTEYPLGLTDPFPYEIVGGQDGNLWFTEFGANKIGKMSPAGTLINEFTIPTAYSHPRGITAGPSTSPLWFTEENADKVATITTAGVITEFALPAGADPADITFGVDGNLFITEPGLDQIARIEPDGSPITQFSSGISPGADPTSITSGPGGVGADLWFTEPGVDKIGRMTPSGVVTEFNLPAGADPAGIVTGQDGKVWFTEPGIDKIGRIDPSAGSTLLIQASLTHFDTGLTAGSNPQTIAAGADGNLWFAELDNDKIGRINTALDPPKYQNPGPIDINGGTANQGATAYPSTINVNQPPASYGAITDVSLRLTGLSHTYPDDIDILLVSPTGTALRAMTDTGGGGATPVAEVGTTVNGVTLNVSDTFGLASIPDAGPLVSGRFSTGQGTGGTSFPAPAPASPYATAFSTFDAVSANGTWSLYVNDDAGGDTGAIYGGWGLDIETVGVANDDTIPPRLEDALGTLSNVLGNDTGTPLTITSVSDPAHGTATIVGDPTEIVYDTDDDYCNSPGGSPDTFTYTIPNGDTATISAPTITCVDDPSVANDDTRTVAEDSGTTSFNVTANDTDAFEEQTQITAVTDPAHGAAAVVQGSPDTIAYTPDADYCNDSAPPDTLDYTVDGGDTATVSVAVTCVDEPVPPAKPAPETTITKAPEKLKAKRKTAKATFEFSSSLPGASFACALDGAAPTPCSSPTTLKVKKGSHRFAVIATVAGVSDATAATASFKVKKKRKR